MRRLACLASVALVSASEAALVTYDFTGLTNVGGSTHTFTGVFEYEHPTPSSTVYYNGNGPLQVGFRSSYNTGLRRLSITLDNNETVTAGPGPIHFNNIEEAPPGSQVPAGLSVQGYSSGATGTINGLSVWNLYLAFLPVPTTFDWGPLDAFMGGDAKAMLQANPSLLPSSIDPTLTGTALPADVLTVMTGGVFLGTTHATTTTVNQITSFHLRVPGPGGVALLGVAGLCVGRRRRVS